MKSISTALARLLHAAAKVPGGCEVEPSAELVRRVLLCCRARALARENGFPIDSLQLGLAVACVLTLFLVALQLPGALARPEDALNAWNTLPQLSWMP